MRHFVLAIATTALLGSAAHADSVNIAVAANFTDAANEIAAAFAQASDHEAILSFGATGQFYTQITQGAPFEILLAADDVRPAQSVEEGYGVDGTVFTYAIGQLVLYSSEEGKVIGAETLEAGDFQQIAIANPETAPYGKAAIETMEALGVYETLRPKIVQGQNIGQAYQFVETGNAEVGFVALGQVSQTDAGSRWLVPQENYEPIRQDAVLLKTGEDNPAAEAFLEFLKGDEATAIIEKYGYALDR
ncbi:molybdate ABC transporter substrate-binding protein [Aliihoeflea aestuarii]|jgi:molybdate transport system substrate-binding protein|uniref:molybdate ABC transporter substrate-binding protein n=1 Tax=Aliihoeflea aestuarii TaxID=453840 RepID=UPI002091EEE1|nr:molybdate ABC transporter substrate-binding protein [Aliihoeflea aestuarii]MCO6391579.1 molybdate ABC transporter substrate-binding protein [Aliihoeflea aestuarii]